jgi:hypothetical protein
LNVVLTHIALMKSYYWHHICLLRKVVCLFCLSHWDLSIHVVPTMLMVWCEKPLISRGVLRWFLNVWMYGAWGIECWTILSLKFQKNKKLKILGKLGHALDIVRKSSLTMILLRWFCNF